MRGLLVSKTDAWMLKRGWGRPPLHLKARWVTFREDMNRVIRSTVAPSVMLDWARMVVNS